MENTTKILIVTCFILVAFLGFMTGILLQVSDELPIRTITVPQDTKEERVTPSAELPEWHEIATFTGSNDDYRCFNIQGEKFKVVMSAVPMITYQPNTMQVEVIKDGSIVATKTLEWGATESPDMKREIIEVTSGPGTYCLGVYAVDLENWQITIWDYY
ncbi:MAG TPA: hypothetical protein GXX41_12755 [Thermoanaerobacterium sp.]|nr:hypothetical protein [Thermoanaerobacterium sp.]